MKQKVSKQENNNFSNATAKIENIPDKSISNSSNEEFEKIKEKLRFKEEQYIRAVADLENYRRRVIRERAEIIKIATEKLLEELLPILDSLKMGLDAAKKCSEVADFIKGFEMSYKELSKTLEINGLFEINPLGKIFDPNLHECVSHMPSNKYAENEVIEVIRIGYMLSKKLLRPATVVVCNGVS